MVEKLVKQKFVLIMAGGVGSRFWPASRLNRPKQFIDILGTGKSLLRLTYERCLKVTTADRIIVMTNKRYVEQVRNHLPELCEEHIFLEPAMNNTAPCIALASLKLRKKFGDGVCLIAPSDHIILYTEEFRARVEQAMSFAVESEGIVTMGMQPTRPDIGYGYIQMGAEVDDSGIHSVTRFTEKPTKATAEQFLASGEYLWNSGMFVWSLNAILSAFIDHARNIIDVLMKGEKFFFEGGESDFLEQAYPTTENISIDYAILERAPNIFVLPASFGWSDLGTWGALYHEKEKDEKNNVQIGSDIHLSDCRGILVYSSNNKQRVVVAHVEDVAVIVENDIVFVFSKDNEQEVKRVRSEMIERGFIA